VIDAGAAFVPVESKRPTPPSRDRGGGRCRGRGDQSRAFRHAQRLVAGLTPARPCSLGRRGRVGLTDWAQPAGRPIWLHLLHLWSTHTEGRDG
jgi:hypothetical protein